MRYVVGFAFDERMKRVALIRKRRPEWQAGLLNGIGGHIEEDESPAQAMAREFREETGYRVGKRQWRMFAVLTDVDSGAVVFFYRAHGVPLERLATTTDEQVEVWDVDQLAGDHVLPTVGWLVPMAADSYVKRVVNVAYGRGEP